LFLSTHTPLPAPPELLPWSPQTAWDALVAVFVDQISLDAEDILYHARIAQDLGVDRIRSSTTALCSIAKKV
jgi:hypothetical protein